MFSNITFLLINEIRQHSSRLNFSNKTNTIKSFQNNLVIKIVFITRDTEQCSRFNSYDNSPY